MIFPCATCGKKFTVSHYQPTLWVRLPFVGHRRGRKVIIFFIKILIHKKNDKASLDELLYSGYHLSWLIVIRSVNRFGLDFKDAVFFHVVISRVCALYPSGSL